MKGKSFPKKIKLQRPSKYSSCHYPCSGLLPTKPARDAALSLGGLSLYLLVELVHLLEGSVLGVARVRLRIVCLGLGLCLELLELGLRLCDLFFICG